MLEALKFVQRGVARREIIPGLTHFRIENGRVTGFNGSLALSAPVDISFNAAPQAGAFVKALDACEDVVTLTMENESRLLVRSGGFRVVVPCVNINNVPTVVPEGSTVTPSASLLKALEALVPFVGVDASRQWVRGILLSGRSAFATNNVVVSECWLGSQFPYKVNLPDRLVEEALRVREELTSMQVAQESVTLHYNDGRWIRSQLLTTEWPDVSRLLSQVWSEQQVMRDVPDGLLAACEKLLRFGSKEDISVFFRGTNISTLASGLEGGGAQVEIADIPSSGQFNTRFLFDVLSVAKRVSFTGCPQKFTFTGDGIRGVMLGMRTL
jgi:DNA polymerase III sliding clamp (beta) subunit (PCNA family)